MRWTRPAATAGIAAAVSALSITGLASGLLDGVQSHWEDLLQPGLAGADDVVVVAIDRPTMQAVGAAWPWDRHLHAELLDAVGSAEPAIVVYDVLFAGARDGDAELAAALRRTPTVLASGLTLAPQADGPPTVVDERVPEPALAAAARSVGSANVTVSADRGVVRSLPLYALDERGIVTPSLVLEAVAALDGYEGPVTERPGGAQIGSRFIPLQHGDLRINWTDELSAAETVSALDVLEQRIEPDRLAGRVVLVGVTEPTLGDQHLVPVDRSGGTAGVFVLANATNTVLSEGYLRSTPTSTTAVVIVALAALVTAAFVWGRLTLATVAAVVATGAYVVYASWRFHTDGELWNVTWPPLAAFAAGGAGMTWRYLTEIRHRRRAWQLFATYVPASVVNQLQDHRRLSASAAGVRVDASVVFCDLRGFTPLAGTLPPAQVRSILDRYYDYAVAVVHRHEGTVMQFVGDEVLAVFGAPVQRADDAERALRCALDLRAEVDRLDSSLAADGLPPVRFGIGLHRGEVVAAHIGTSNRRQYGVVGNTVNVGSRLCASAAAGEIVATVEALVGPGDASAGFGAPTPIELKGVDAPVLVRRLGAATSVRADTHPPFRG